MMASSFESRETGAALVWKGSFCFIRPDGGGDNLFCHRKEIEDGDYLEQGARVTFVRGVTGRGPCAQHVRGGASRAIGDAPRAPPPPPTLLRDSAIKRPAPPPAAGADPSAAPRPPQQPRVPWCGCVLAVVRGDRDTVTALVARLDERHAREKTRPSPCCAAAPCDFSQQLALSAQAEASQHVAAAQLSAVSAASRERGAMVEGLILPAHHDGHSLPLGSREAEQLASAEREVRREVTCAVRESLDQPPAVHGARKESGAAAMADMETDNLWVLLGVERACTYTEMVPGRGLRTRDFRTCDLTLPGGKIDPTDGGDLRGARTPSVPSTNAAQQASRPSPGGVCRSDVCARGKRRNLARVGHRDVAWPCAYLHRHRSRSKQGQRILCRVPRRGE